MKKTFLVFAALAALCLTGCDFDLGGDDEKNGGGGLDFSAFIGTWYGTGTDSSYTLVIGADLSGLSGSWNLTDGSSSWSGSWSGSGSVLSFHGSDYTTSGTAILSGSNLSVSIDLGKSSTTMVFTKSASSGGGGTQMTIRNESSYNLSDVTWSTLKFVSSGQTADLLMGTTATKETTDDASGYIYFIRKDIGISLRTQTISTAENSPVTINNNTVVVQIGNDSNTGSLSQITLPSMTIRNDSTYDLSDVTWSGLKFVSSGQTADLLMGTSSKMNAEEDASGYIYLTRKDSGISLRTQASSTMGDSPVTIHNDTVVVEIGHETNMAALSLIEKTPSTTPTLTWTGSWVETAPNSYHSNPIGHSAETWETLTISAPSACTLTVNLSSSSYGGFDSWSGFSYYDYGYASYLDGSPSPSQYRLRVYGTSGSSASGVYNYKVPAGTHYLYFGYVKDYSHTSGLDRIYVSVTVQ
jgi:hypothetical protein